MCDKGVNAECSRELIELGECESRLLDKPIEFVLVIMLSWNVMLLWQNFLQIMVRLLTIS